MTVGGCGIGGICLIRLTDVRPGGVHGVSRHGVGERGPPHRRGVGRDADGRRTGRVELRRGRARFSSVEFDCALLMRDIDHESQQREPICLAEPDGVAAAE